MSAKWLPVEAFISLGAVDGFLRMRSCSAPRGPSEPETESNGTSRMIAPRTDRSGAIAPWIFILWLAICAGCKKESPQVAERPPVVPISRPVERAVTDYVDFTGRTDAVQSVNVVARVTGYLVKMPFEEGADVKKGDLLFQIDPQPYEAQVRLGEAQMAANDAQYQLAKQNYDRAQLLLKKKGILQQEFDQYKAAEDQALAQLNASKASLDIYRLNLQYARVTSPIDGRVSRYFLTLGNLVNQDQTLLTTVVSLDPIYAYFDVDQRTLLRIRTAINEGKMRPRRTSGAPTTTELPNAKPPAAEGTRASPSAAPSLRPTLTPSGIANPTTPVIAQHEIPVLLGMPGDNNYPYKGLLNFANNQLNPSTGSIAARGVFANPQPPGGVRLMSPGMFVRIRLPLGEPHPALLVIDRAIQSDQGQKYVYVVNAAHKTEYRQIVTGALQEDGLRVISNGLKAGDWVVVGALQQVRPNMSVTTEQTKMPSFGATTGAR
jgi:multidrug efflux system membrane fusion protein